LDTTHSINSPSALVSRLSLLWPFVLGIAFSRSGAIAGSYGNYAQTDAGTLTEASALVALFVSALALPILFMKDGSLNRKFVYLLAIATIILMGCSLLGLLALHFFSFPYDLAMFFCSTSAVFFGRLSLFYWLRRIKGMGPLNVTLTVFAALIVSELVISLYVSLPQNFSYFVAALIVLSQLAFLRKSFFRSRQLLDSTTVHCNDYFGYAKSFLSSKRFLIVSAFGIGLTAIVIGLLRGYPSGDPIAFTGNTRTGYVFLTIALSILIVALAIKGYKNVMSLGAWVIMQVLACLALLCYAAFPADLHIGAVFTTTMNAMMVAFAWYIIVAFSSYGWKDPYYYAISCYIIWIGGRAFSRITLSNSPALNENSLLVSVLIGVFLLLSAQVVYTQYISIAAHEAKNDLEKTTARKSALEKLMGLDGNMSSTDLRKTSMTHSAEIVGRQFLLSRREVEVLSLYALGYTQKKVAQELHVSQSTVHTHIKRIYIKTGIHSRQALLDYIREHAV